MMRKINRKAITPLMVTFLLLSFAGAVGVVVMNLGSAQVEEQAQCAIDIGLKFVSISGVDDICYSSASKELQMTIENGVNIKVEGVIVNIIGTEKAESFELNDAKVIKAGSYQGRVKYDSSVSGTIRQVKVVPKVVMYDAEEICTEQALIAENIREC